MFTTLILLTSHAVPAGPVMLELCRMLRICK